MFITGVESVESQNDPMSLYKTEYESDWNAKYELLAQWSSQHFMIEFLQYSRAWPKNDHGPYT